MKARTKPDHLWLRARLLGWLVTGAGGIRVWAADEPPTLRPPRGEWQPAWWETDRWFLVLAGATAVLVLAALVRIFSQRMPGKIATPFDTAREELQALATRRGELPNTWEVARVVRGYLVAMINLPAGELTTGELQAALAANTEVRMADAKAIIDFLRRCDEARFAPAQSAANSAVTAAVDLLIQLEAGRKPAGTTTIRRRSTSPNGSSSG